MASNQDNFLNSETARTEPYRPQFHFTSRRGWMGDINGLVFYKGEYHLHHQVNPTGPDCDYSNMHWGHAVSNDLVHWNDLPPSISPDANGSAFSGTAVVDRENSSGLQTGEEEVLVAFYTAAGYILPANLPGIQCMAFSNDRGRSWTKYEGNPVVGPMAHYTRDPKVFWHEPSRTWIMALILSEAGTVEDNTFGLFSSTDLRHWTLVSKLDMPPACDCPDMFELPVDGNPDNRRWVFWGGDCTYVVGSFDGRNFTPEDEIQNTLVPWNENGSNGYAAQTFNGIPSADGRRIQIAWLRHGDYPGMAFYYQTAFPCELKLRTTPLGIRLCRLPVQEVERLHRKHHHWADTTLVQGESSPVDIAGELFDIRAELELSGEVRFELNGQTVAYDANTRRVSCMGYEVELPSPAEGSIRLQILVDRNSIELFVNEGEASLTYCFLPKADQKGVRVSASVGSVRIISVDVHELSSIWT